MSKLDANGISPKSWYYDELGTYKILIVYIDIHLID